MHDIDRTQIAYPGEMESYPMTSESSVLSEAEEMELASRLMELETEEEFENFLGDIISGMSGGLINSKTGNALGGLLKGAAKTLLPIAGTVAGGRIFRRPHRRKPGRQAGREPRRFSRDGIGGQAEWEIWPRTSCDSPPKPRGMRRSRRRARIPTLFAHQATSDAAQKHAPELIEHGAPQPGSPQAFPSDHHGHGGCSCHHRRHHGGHWVRRGHEIVLYGV